QNLFSSLALERVYVDLETHFFRGQKFSIYLNNEFKLKVPGNVILLGDTVTVESDCPVSIELGSKKFTGLVSGQKFQVPMLDLSKYQQIKAQVGDKLGFIRTFTMFPNPIVFEPTSVPSTLENIKINLQLAGLDEIVIKQIEKRSMKLFAHLSYPPIFWRMNPYNRTVELEKKGNTWVFPRSEIPKIFRPNHCIIQAELQGSMPRTIEEIDVK
ncbi:hypothetical protein O9G_005897, partial [Rozella allomycis CSF55]